MAELGFLTQTHGNSPRTLLVRVTANKSLHPVWVWVPVRVERWGWCCDSGTG